MSEIIKKPPPTIYRIVSLDLFRGFAIFGMILVNYLGDFEIIPDTLKHPRYGMTFANLIAPYFLFAVGMGMRMSLLRRMEKVGYKKAVWHAVKRYFILILIGIVVYGPDPVMNMWDALVDIGVAGLITLPFLLRNKAFRIILSFLLLIVYQLIFALTSYGEWTMANSIDGGPLGPISWASILIFGTIQMDWLKENSSWVFTRASLIFGISLMFLGYTLSLLQPALLWDMSQRSMTIAYPIFASGLSVLTFLVFYLLGDIWKVKIPHLAILGLNPLVIYIIQHVLIVFYGNTLPRTAPLWQALSGFVIIYGICYLIANYLARNKIIIKL